MAEQPQDQPNPLGLKFYRDAFVMTSNLFRPTSRPILLNGHLCILGLWEGLEFWL